MGKNKSHDPLRKSGKHSAETRQKYGHEHYEQIPLHSPNQPPLNSDYLSSNRKGNPTKKKGK